MEIQSGSRKILFAAKLSLLFSSIFSLLFGGEPNTVQNAGIDDFKWKNRLIVISAPSPSDRYLLDQRKLLLGRSEEILDRDLKIIQITGRGQNLIDDLHLSRESAAEFQCRLGLSMKAFQILLVGKDGTVKLKSPEPVPAGLIFSLIDSMPMRQREMRESNDPL